MRNKFLRNIIFSVIGIGILVGLYYLVEKMPDKNEKPQNDIAKTSSIEVFKFEKSNITQVHIENADGSYTIYKKDDKNYAIKEYENVEFSNSLISSLLYEIADVYATKEITDNKDQYGMQTPQAKATIILNDGSQSIVTIGDKVVGDNGYFLGFNNKIYVITEFEANPFKKSVNSFRETNIANIDNTSIKEFKLSNKSAKIAEIRPINEDEKGTFTATAGYIMIYPKYISVNTDAFSKLLQNISGINVLDFIEDNPTDVSKYGIGNVVFTIADNNGSYTIRYGNKDENGNVYSMIDGNNFVFTQDSTLYDILSKTETLGLVDKFAHIINLEKVKNVTFEGQGKRFNLFIEGEGEGANYFINDISVGNDKFKKAYQAIIGISINGFAEKQVDVISEYTVTFSYKDGTVDKFIYSTYDERSYAISKEGKMDYIILKKNLSAAMDEIESILK